MAGPVIEVRGTSRETEPFGDTMHQVKPNNGDDTEESRSCPVLTRSDLARCVRAQCMTGRNFLRKVMGPFTVLHTYSTEFAQGSMTFIAPGPYGAHQPFFDMT